MRICQAEAGLRFSASLRCAPPVTWAAFSACLAIYAQPLEPAALLASGAALGIAALASAFFQKAQRGKTSWPVAARRAAPGLCAGLLLGAWVLTIHSALPPPCELTSCGSIQTLEGLAVSDSTLTAAGNLSVTVELRSLDLRNPRFALTLMWPKGRMRMRLIAPAGVAVLKGDQIVAESIQPIGEEGAPAEIFYAKKIRTLGTSPGAVTAGMLRRVVRSAAAERIRKVSGSAYPLSQALLLGMTDALGFEEEEIFRKAGCAHVLSLSGQHLSILCLMVSLVFSKLAKRPLLAAPVSVFLASGFTWIAGSGPSLVRSAVTLALALAARKLDRPMKGLSALALTFCVCAGLDPASTKSLSFILSYAAMAGLILLSKPWEEALWRLPVPLAKALAPSLAAICSTAPISAAIFGTVALGGLVAATLSNPVVLVFMWSLIGTSIVGLPFPWMDPFLARWHEFVHEILLHIMRLGALVPAARAQGPSGLLLAAISVVGICGFVYAFPYVEYLIFEIRPAKKAAGKP